MIPTDFGIKIQKDENNIVKEVKQPDIVVFLNGQGHNVSVKTSDPSFIPEDLVIKLSTTESYGGPWRGGIPNAVNISLNNQTDRLFKVPYFFQVCMVEVNGEELQ